MSQDFSRWMEKLLPLIGSQPINRLVLPECHDSFTAEIQPTGPVSQDEPEWMKSFASVPCIGPIEKKIIQAWGITQKESAREQFNSGMRSFDIRVALREVNGTMQLWSCHGLYSIPIETALSELSECINHNRNELIILRFDHQYGTEETVRTQLNALITRYFDNMLIPRSWGPKTTLDQALASQKQVIATSADPKLVEQNPNVFPLADCPWYNAQSAQTLIESLTTQIQKKSSNLSVAQLILTPNTSVIASGVLFASCGAPNSLAKYAHDNNPTIMNWLAQQSRYSQNLNILNADFTALTPLVEIAILFNIKNGLQRQSRHVTDNIIAEHASKSFGIKPKQQIPHAQTLPFFKPTPPSTTQSPMPDLKMH